MNLLTRYGILSQIKSFVRFGRAYFDGAGDYLSLNSDAANFGFVHNVGTTGKWTMEFKYQANSFSNAQTLFDTTRGSTGNSGIYITLLANRTIRVFISRDVAASYVINYTSGVIYPNDTASMHDIEISYDQSLASNNLSIYIDGVLLANGSKTANASSSIQCETPYIGTFASSDYINGYLTGFRITDGIIRHTATFTPPEYFINDSGTALCMNFAEAIGATTFIDETGKTVTTNGNVIIVA